MERSPHVGMNRFLWACMILSLLLSFWGVAERISLERSRRGSAVVVDGSRFYQFVDQSDMEDRVSRLLNAGAQMFLVPEYTGAELLEGALPGVVLAEENDIPVGQVKDASSVLTVSDETLVDPVGKFLTARFPGVQRIDSVGQVKFILPISRRLALKAGLLPDFPLCEALRKRDVPFFYRPMPWGQGEVEPLLNSVDTLKEAYGNLVGLLPGGDVVAAYPESQKFGAWLKSSGLLLGQAEFSTQVGASSLCAASWPNLASVHAVTDDEVITRKIQRLTMIARLKRAAEERSVQLLVLRPDVLRGVSQRLTSFEAEVASLTKDLSEKGLGTVQLKPWAETSSFAHFIAGLGLSLGLCVLLYRYLLRYRPSWFNSRVLMSFAAVVVIAWLPLCKIGSLTRLSGGLYTGLLATEATLMAMSGRSRLRSSLEAVGLVILGGLTLVGFFAQPLYMSRMVTFSGVKLTLLLPILLVLAHDLSTGEHPESAMAILKRPSLWYELFLIGAVMLGGLIMIVRSDNTAFVPGFERLFREFLENILIARPRTKELWIGYPALFIWTWMKNHGYGETYREVFRLAVTLAFSSAVNTFCHFHTPLKLSLLRVFNGWWTGCLVGCVVLLFLTFVTRKLRRS